MAGLETGDGDELRMMKQRGRYFGWGIKLKLQPLVEKLRFGGDE